MDRNQTRQERYASRLSAIKTIPVSIATIDFVHDNNVGFLARAIACFGGEQLHVVGHIPPHADMRRLSGGMGKFVPTTQHKNPSSLLDFVRRNDLFLISAELDRRAVNLSDLVLPDDGRHIMVVVGNETTGVPEEILHCSDAIVQIPMLGIGWCLNTSQTGNIMLYELAKRYT